MGRNTNYYGIRFDRRSQNFGFHMIAQSQLIANRRSQRSQTIADDRRSVFPYDRRRSQNFLRSAIRDPRSSAIIWKPAFNQLTAPRKFDFLQTNILILRTSNFQGATIRPIVPRQTLYCLYRSPLNFPPRVIQKSY